MVEVGEFPDPVSASVEKSGCEMELGSAVDVFDEPQGDGPGYGLGILPAQTAKRIGSRCDGDELILPASCDEVVECGSGISLQTEQGMHAPLRMRQQHPVGVVAAVVDDDVSCSHGGEMGERGGALIAVGMQVEVDGEFRGQFVEATQQALRIVGPFLRQGVALPFSHFLHRTMRPVHRRLP